MGTEAGEGAAGAATMGDGWLLTHAEAFADSPETRALVTGPHTTLRSCELVPELPMYLSKGEDILQLWARVEAFADEKDSRVGGEGSPPESARADDDDDDVAAAGVGSKLGGGGGGGGGLHPPYWAVPWVGGQGVARYILDNPEVVRGKSVLDVGSGCGVAALAAARAGAALVCANDIDPLAAVAFLANAEACGLGGNGGGGDDAGAAATAGLNENTHSRAVGAMAGAGAKGSSSQASERGSPPPPCTLQTSFEDLLGTSAADVAHFDVIMAGDVCFMKGLSDTFQAWLSSVSRRSGGCVTLLGDPSRKEQWAPGPGWAEGMERVAEYEVTTDAADVNPLTEGLTTRKTVVWRSG